MSARTEIDAADLEREQKQSVNSDELPCGMVLPFGYEQQGSSFTEKENMLSD